MTEPDAVGGAPEQPLLDSRPRWRSEPGRWRLEPVGEIDLSNAAALASACEPLLDLSGVSLEIDLRELRYLDSSGIGAIGHAASRLRVTRREPAHHEPVGDRAPRPRAVGHAPVARRRQPS